MARLGHQAVLGLSEPQVYLVLLDSLVFKDSLAFKVYLVLSDLLAFRVHLEVLDFQAQ